MITAVHTLIYADDALAARAFFRDVLDFPHVDAGEGWLIFRTGPSELGVHPTATGEGDQRWTTDPHHEMTLMCDDIEETVRSLEAKGAQFTAGIKDDGLQVQLVAVDEGVCPQRGEAAAAESSKERGSTGLR